ncbi:serine hydrolase [Tundrisphaera sp. TA3]|uniref:serine hydrolase n=1 Tax=Tundrisphaera sp. TA3 TaxID=3435775 RepID=UPI003EC004AA
MHHLAKAAIAAATLLAGLAFTTRAEAFVDPARVMAVVPALEDYVARSQAKTGVPGLSIAIVAGDRIVYLRGFGVRRVGQKNAPVTPNTVFQLASLSKPISSTVVAGLVGRGGVRFDTRIASLIPGFRMSSPDTTANVTVRDMLSHQSGLPEYAGDVLVDVGFSRHELIERTRFLPLNAPLRGRYNYSNVGYTIGAAAAARPSGRSWEDTAEAILYRPLGMTSTSSRYADYMKARDRATPHVRSGSGTSWVPRNPPNDDDAEAPAGGVSSSARDMANYLRLQLRDGTFNGKRVIAAGPLAETRTAQVQGTSGEYGLGWNVGTDSAGRSRISHSGAFNSGAATDITIYPGEDVGIVVLTNSYPIGLPEAISAGFFDLLFQGAVARDYVTLFGGIFDQFWDEIEEKYPAYPPTVPNPPRALASYAGTYASPLFGRVEVVRSGRGLAIRLGPKQVTYPLSHYSGDVFLFTPVGENAYLPSGARFDFGGRGQARAVTIDYYNTEGQGTLTRVPR